MSIKRLSTGSISSTTPKNSKVWDQETFPGTFESIASATVDASGASSIAFSNIPQNYTHLQIRGVMKNTSNSTNLYITFNSDTTSNYSSHYLFTDGQTISASAVNTSYMFLGRYQSSTGSNIFGTCIIDFLDYSNTNKNKTVKSISGFDANGSGNLLFSSGSWRSTSALSTITLNTDAGNWAQYSSFSLYGIRG